MTTFILLTLLAHSCLGRPRWQPDSITFNERGCTMCRFSVTLVNYAIQTQKGADQIYKFANNFCTIAHYESPLVCSRISKLFNHEIVKVLSHGLITPDQVCGYLSKNKCGTYRNPMGDWEVNLNVSASLNQAKLARLHSDTEKPRDSRKPFRVIHISDTHIDLKYEQGSRAVCDEPLCCRKESHPTNGSDIKAGYWGSRGECDLPIRTLESALKAINASMHASDDIKYIIWTGDIQPHDVWDQNKKSAMRIYDSVFSKIFEYLPNARIFPTLGNHEMVPVDSFSPSNLLSIARDDSPEWLYKKLDSFWSRWLPPSTVETITKDGFYATIVEEGLKLISLNTNFCHNKNFWLYINSTDPGNQLQWLIHELQMSELLHEKVHIIGHIPPGSDDCLKVWSRNFNKILRRYSKTVSGQFYGHTHNNEFEIFYDQDQRVDDKSQSENVALKPISVALIGPSITTFIDQNPSFRIYHIDSDQGFVPTDFETIFMNLTLANIDAERKEPEWISLGTFAEQFGIKDISAPSLHSLLLEMARELRESEDFSASKSSALSNTHIGKSNDSKLSKLYLLFNSLSEKFSEAGFNNLSSEAKQKFLCRFFTGESHNSAACDQFIRGIVSSNEMSEI